MPVFHKSVWPWRGSWLEIAVETVAPDLVIAPITPPLAEFGVNASGFNLDFRFGEVRQVVKAERIQSIKEPLEMAWASQPTAKEEPKRVVLIDYPTERRARLQIKGL